MGRTASVASHLSKSFSKLAMLLIEDAFSNGDDGFSLTCTCQKLKNKKIKNKKNVESFIVMPFHREEAST